MAASLVGVPTLRVQEPLDHQWPDILDPSRRKLWRKGRRWGKTRGVFYIAQLGHGPLDPDTGLHTMPGIMHGLDVFWVVPEYPQARAIWREEIRPRFKDRPGFELNATERRLTVEATGGSLIIVSSESIDNVRGSGDRLGGVVVDEAAHQDLEYALQAVLTPALTDNTGWLIAVSTTNCGQDGNTDKRVPSYFNVLCQEVRAGENATWTESHGDARDNPVLPDGAFEALVDEYDDGSLKLQEEVYAALLDAGAGLAFPEWKKEVHTTTFEPERDKRGEWRWAAGGDWGYTAPGCFLLAAGGAERRVVVRRELYFKETDPYTAGYTFAQVCEQIALPEYLALDSACWAVTDGGATIADRVQEGIKAALGTRAFPVLSAPKGPGSRVAGKMLVHEALRYKRAKDGTVPAWSAPRLRVHATDCANLARVMAKLPRDEKNPEDVDTTKEDHPYDALRYLYAAGIPGTAREVDTEAQPGRVKGFTKGGQRRATVPTFEQVMRRDEEPQGRAGRRGRVRARRGEDDWTGDDE